MKSNFQCGQSSICKNKIDILYKKADSHNYLILDDITNPTQISLRTKDAISTLRTHTNFTMSYRPIKNNEQVHIQMLILNEQRTEKIHQVGTGKA